MRKNLILITILFLMIPVLSAYQEQEPVDPVNWRELQEYLVDFSGYEREGEPDGETVSMGNMKWTHVEQNYRSGDKSLKLEIIDSAYVGMALQSFQMAAAMEIDTSDEYVKSTEINGFPGVKRYTYEDKQGEVMVLVGERFLIRLEGEPFEDADPLVDLIKEVDIEGLAALTE